MVGVSHTYSEVLEEGMHRQMAAHLDASPK